MGILRIITLERLKLITIAAPTVFVVVVLALYEFLSLSNYAVWAVDVGVVILTFIAALIFSEVVFGIVSRLQAGLSQQNKELLALHQAGLDIAGELNLESVLQKIVDQARELVGARYGALLTINESGLVDTYITSGYSPGDVKASELGAFTSYTSDYKPIRISGKEVVGHILSLPSDQTAHSLLTVPILSGDKVLGNLFVAGKESAREFTEEDEETLSRFATQAALAIENARLHEQVKALAIAEERERIAREMHDSLAQVLTYVTTKGHATQMLLERGELDKASKNLSQLVDAARSAYSDVREQILALRTSQERNRGFIDVIREYAQKWQDQSGIPVQLDIQQGLSVRLTPTTDLQVIRIVQEALSNIRKHSGATQAWITIYKQDDRLVVTIKDNGAGFDPSSLTRSDFPRFGLAMMRERAESVGAELNIDTGPRQGTEIRLRIPLSKSELQAGSSKAYESIDSR